MGMGYLDGTQTDRLGLAVSPKKRDYFGLHREV
jgi:6-phosphogluconate dehydrogenase